MSHAREYRLMNHAVAEQRSHWWNGDQARLTVPTFLQEEPSHERSPACR
jgi:hypothetical protein